MIHRLIIIFLLFFAFSSRAQYSVLIIDLTDERALNSGDTTYYQIQVTCDTGIIYNKINNSLFKITIDSLKPGNYKIDLYDVTKNNNKEVTITKQFELKENKRTYMYIDIPTIYIQDHNLNKITIDERSEGSEMSVSFSFFDSKWTNKESVLRNNFTVGFSLFESVTLAKHISAFLGGGIGYSYYSFSKDTTFMDYIGGNLKRENYNYCDAHIDGKLRFKLGNKLSTKSFTGVFIDIGAVYNAPLIFKHRAVYEGNKKLSVGRLHQFTDTRAYVNLGFNPFQVFFEYRLTDFIIGNYPELPKFNLGIRFFGSVN